MKNLRIKFVFLLTNTTKFQEISVNYKYRKFFIVFFLHPFDLVLLEILVTIQNQYISRNGIGNEKECGYVNLRFTYCQLAENLDDIIGDNSEATTQSISQLNSINIQISKNLDALH